MKAVAIDKRMSQSPQHDIAALQHASFEDLVHEMLNRIGEDPSREGLRETPERGVKSLEYLTHGYSLEPADVLILDEPTNDLDIPTLEILEESLLEFAGALVLVTHDRYLLDRVTNAVLGLDGLGNAALFADYLQWEAWRAEQTRAAAEKEAGNTPEPVPAAVSAPSARRKLSYMEQREYDTLEVRIEAADTRLRAAEQRIESADVVTNPEALTVALAELEAARTEHHTVYERWLELTEKIGG